MRLRYGLITKVQQLVTDIAGIEDWDRMILDIRGSRCYHPLRADEEQSMI